MNSEIGNSDFKDRLKLLIGDKKPYIWAKEVGIPSATFDRIWREGSIPKAEHLLRIAKKSNVSVDWLLGAEPASMASPDYRDAPGIDGELLGKLTEAVQALYREENQRIGMGQSVKVATRLYSEIVEVPEDQRAGAMTLRLNQLRRELQTASSGSTTGKSSA